MVINNDDKKTLIKANKKVTIEKKRQVWLNNIKVAKDLRLLTNEKFKSKVKKNVKPISRSPHPSCS